MMSHIVYLRLLVAASMESSDCRRVAAVSPIEITSGTIIAVDCNISIGCSNIILCSSGEVCDGGTKHNYDQIHYFLKNLNLVVYDVDYVFQRSTVAMIAVLTVADSFESFVFVCFTVNKLYGINKPYTV